MEIKFNQKYEAIRFVVETEDSLKIVETLERAAFIALDDNRHNPKADMIIGDIRMEDAQWDEDDVLIQRDDSGKILNEAPVCWESCAGNVGRSVFCRIGEFKNEMYIGDRRVTGIDDFAFWALEHLKDKCFCSDLGYSSPVSNLVKELSKKAAALEENEENGIENDDASLDYDIHFSADETESGKEEAYPVRFNPNYFYTIEF